MEAPEVCRRALQGSGTDGMTQWEELLYHRVRLISRDYFQGTLTKKEATQRKAKAIFQMNSDRSQILDGRAAILREAQRNIRLERVKREYRLHPSIENANAVMAALDGF